MKNNASNGGQFATDFLARFGRLPQAEDPARMLECCEELYAKVVEERNQLKQELDRLREDREAFLEGLHIQACSRVGEKEEMLALVGKGKSFEALISELDAGK